MDLQQIYAYGKRMEAWCFYMDLLIIMGQVRL